MKRLLETAPDFSLSIHPHVPRFHPKSRPSASSVAPKATSWPDPKWPGAKSQQCGVSKVQLREVKVSGGRDIVS